MSSDKKIEADLKSTFGDEGAHQLRQTLKSVDANWSSTANEKLDTAPREAKIRRMPIGRMMRIAASLLLFVVAGWWVFGGGSSSTPQELYGEYASPYRVTMVARNVTDESLFQTAQTAYQKEDFETAYANFNQLAQQDPSATQFQFYAGVSALMDGKAATAIPIFKSLLNQSNHLFIEQSRWYLALAHLQEENIASAKTYLSEIKTGAFKYEDAGELLGKL